jgi:hypothetical protein
MRAVAAAAAVLLLGACGAGRGMADVVLDTDSNQSSGMTGFTVQGAWVLKYSWDCQREAAEGLQGIDHFDMLVTNTEDLSTAFEHPEVTREGRRGSGTLHYGHAGEYEVDFNTKCDWTLQVVDLSQ